MASLTLFYSPGACSMAPHVVLESLGVPYEAVAVPIREGAHRRAEYLAVNPRGLLPALRVGQDVLTENPALLAWLGAAHPQAGLLAPAGTLEHGRALEWLAWLAGTLHAAYAQLWRTARFVGEGAPAEVVEAVAAAGRARIASCSAEIDARLAGGGFAVGGRFGVVDANLLPFYRWGGLVGLDMRAGFPHWTAHAERLAARPDVQRVLAREGVALWP